MPLTQNIDELVAAMLGGDMRALSRLMTRVETRPDEVPEIMRRVYPKRRPARRVGLSGPPGAGKSTLLNNMIRHAHDVGSKVGVLCIDPTSPLSGGAILGDRIRITEMFPPEDVFIRSVASGDSLGGLSVATRMQAVLLEAAGCDLVFIETVGLGQVGYDITDVAESLVLVLVPESGDTVQILKSGIIELADIVVVNKADRDGAQQIAETLRITFDEPRDDWHIPVLLTNAREDEGTGELINKLDDHFEYLQNKGKLAAFRGMDTDFMDALSSQLRRTLTRGFAARHPAFKDYYERMLRGEMDPYSAAAEAIERLLGWEKGEGRREK